jgi:hypothetical protein
LEPLQFAVIRANSISTMSNSSNSPSLKSVSLRLSQKQFEPGDFATIDPNQSEPSLPKVERADHEPEFGKSAPGSTPTAEVLAQISTLLIEKESPIFNSKPEDSSTPTVGVRRALVNNGENSLRKFYRSY